MKKLSLNFKKYSYSILVKSNNGLIINKKQLSKYDLISREMNLDRKALKTKMMHFAFRKKKRIVKLKKLQPILL